MYEDALNRDDVAKNQFAQLIKQFKIKTFIETGTYHGVTTEWLSSLVKTVHTIEINENYQTIAKERLESLQNVHMHIGNSPEVLSHILPLVTVPVMFFLDAHWGTYCPLNDELKAIKASGIIDPVITIHDFQVPNTTLGFDVYDGQALSLERVEPFLPNLYSNGYKINYNDETAGGARRGILYVSPIG